MNIAMLIDMAAEGFGDRIAFGSLDDGVTYSQLRINAQRIASRLVASPARTLAVSCETSLLIPSALFGAAWAGKTYAPLNYRLPQNTQSELLRRLDPADLADSEWLKTSKELENFIDEPENPAVVLFTSGTTAEPKAAVLDHSQLLAYQFNTVEFGGAEESEAVLLAVPPFHIAGVTALLTSTYTGRRVVALPQFDPEAWLATARNENITHAFLVPTMLARIVSTLEESGGTAPSSLQRITYGGARLPISVLQRALDYFPTTGFANAYGLTETSSTVTLLGPDDHRTAHASDDPTDKARLGSAGRPVPGIEIRVIASSGEVAENHTTGKIEVRGDQVSGDYLGSYRDRSDWLATGDCGYLDDEGFLFVEGRDDDTIIKGGENISPVEIEDALLTHPEVDSVAVVGIYDEEWGEKIGAVVVTRTGSQITTDELQTWTKEKVGSFKTPSVILMCFELPLTPTGKVMHRQVRSDLEALGQQSET